MARISRKVHSALGDEGNAQWKLALYVRLSVEDNGLAGRDSVGNQLELIQNFVSQIENVSESYSYVDNGATGTNFEREHWDQLILDVKNRKINCIVVKDLSRFARNYIEAGDYLEKIFPFLGVRFIAVNDCYDSSNLLFKENGLTVSLKNLINDYYAKDISKKVMSSFHTKKENGEFIGSKAPYGYILKDNHFLIDPEAAAIVKRIYELFLQGNSGYAIAKILNEEQISSPSRYAYEKGEKKYRSCSNVIWQSQTVTKILYNETYTGKLIQGKTNCSRYSHERIGVRPQEEWMVIPNAHEAIIDEGSFEIVQQARLKNQELRKIRCNSKKENQCENILLGYIFCGVCGHPLRRSSTARRGKKEYAFYCATKYFHNDAECTTASISDKKIFAAILSYIRVQIDVAVEADDLLQRLQSTALKSKEYQSLCEKVQRDRKEYKRIMTLKSSIYEDYKQNILTKEEYILVKERYTQCAEQLEQTVQLNEKKKALYEENLTNRNKWVHAFKRFKNAKEVTREMIEILVEKIELFPDKRMQITFRFSDEYKSAMQYIEENGGTRKEETADAGICSRIS